MISAEPTAQVPLQKRAESHLLSRGWRSWPWQLILLLCDCLTSICINAEQTAIKRMALFGSETSSDNIIAYAKDVSTYEAERKTNNETSTSRIQDELVCLMQVVQYRMKKDPDTEGEDQSWRIRYTGLLCMSQIYRHFQKEGRHKTLTNLIWMFIDVFSKNERDDRVIEALKVGRVRKLFFWFHFQMKINIRSYFSSTMIWVKKSILRVKKFKSEQFTWVLHKDWQMDCWLIRHRLIWELHKLTVLEQCGEKLMNRRYLNLRIDSTWLYLRLHHLGKSFCFSLLLTLSWFQIHSEGLFVEIWFQLH